MDPNGGVHRHHLHAAEQAASQASPVPSILPSDGWMFNLQQLPIFNYGCLYAHLVTGSKTVVENQCDAAAQCLKLGQ